MEKIQYELIIKFDSGAVDTFIDENSTFLITDNYKSEVLLTPQLFGIDDLRDYFSLLIIESIDNEDFITCYNKFKEYGDKIIYKLNDGDNIEEVILKIYNTDKIIYDIKKENLVGIEAGGASGRNDVNNMVYRLQFYRRKVNEVS